MTVKPTLADSRAPITTEAFRRNFATWEALGTLKAPLTLAEMEGYRVAHVTNGWEGVADWLDSSGSDYATDCDGFTYPEAAYLLIADKANYFEHLWVDGSLVILTED